MQSKKYQPLENVERKIVVFLRHVRLQRKSSVNLIGLFHVPTQPISDSSPHLMKNHSPFMDTSTDSSYLKPPLMRTLYPSWSKKASIKPEIIHKVRLMMTKKYFARILKVCTKKQKKSSKGKSKFDVVLPTLCRLFSKSKLLQNIYRLPIKSRFCACRWKNYVKQWRQGKRRSK